MPREGRADLREQLASGAIVRAMAQRSSGDTREAMNALVDGLGRADVESDEVLYLEALGNTGDARAFAAIVPYLSHESDALRAAAASGMRFMADDAADQALAAALADPEIEVQKAAVSALRHRPLGAPSRRSPPCSIRAPRARSARPR